MLKWNNNNTRGKTTKNMFFKYLLLATLSMLILLPTNIAKSAGWQSNYTLSSFNVNRTSYSYSSYCDNNGYVTYTTRSTFSYYLGDVLMGTSDCSTADAPYIIFPSAIIKGFSAIYGNASSWSASNFGVQSSGTTPVYTVLANGNISFTVKTSSSSTWNSILATFDSSCIESSTYVSGGTSTIQFKDVSGDGIDDVIYSAASVNFYVHHEGKSNIVLIVTNLPTTLATGGTQASEALTAANAAKASADTANTNAYNAYLNALSANNNASAAYTAATNANTNAYNAYLNALYANNNASVAANNTTYNSNSAAYWAYQASVNSSNNIVPEIISIEGLGGATCTTGSSYSAVVTVSPSANITYTGTVSGAGSGTFSYSGNTLTVSGLTHSGAYTVTVTARYTPNGQTCQSSYLFFKI